MIFKASLKIYGGKIERNRFRASLSSAYVYMCSVYVEDLLVFFVALFGCVDWLTETELELEAKAFLSSLIFRIVRCEKNVI